MIAPSFVYVHAPFCARRCTYCDFAVSVRKSAEPDEWLDALSGELRALELDDVVPAYPLKTLYVGGGTPSLLGPTAMGGLRRLFGDDAVSEDTEWTAEANPESFSAEVARGWRAAGVNRLSIGIQTFSDPALRWMGRLHGCDDAAAAVGRAREAGFESISIDLIFALPDRVIRSWSEDLDQAIALDVDHVSLYGLTFEEQTFLGRALKEGRESVPDDARYAEEYLLACERLTTAGFRHYEVSNFARPGAESRHNAAYWDGSPYLGLGNGAHSFLPPIRRWNHREWEEYRELAQAGRLPMAGSETVEGEARELELIWLGLRTARGVPLESLASAQRTTVEGWTRRGLAKSEGSCVILTPRGWLLLDDLTVELLGDGGSVVA